MPVETMDYLAAVERMLRAAGRRAGDGDEFELSGLVGLHGVLEAATATAIRDWLRMGRSWSDVGRALGVTRTAAHARWAQRVAALEGREHDRRLHHE